MSTNPNYLGPFRNRFSLNLYRKLPLVNSLSLNQSEMVFKKFIFRYQYLVEIYSVSAEKIISDAFSYSENV